jgi:hypothetical protein
LVIPPDRTELKILTPVAPPIIIPLFVIDPAIAPPVTVMIAFDANPEIVPLFAIESETPLPSVQGAETEDPDPIVIKFPDGAGQDTANEALDAIAEIARITAEAITCLFDEGFPFALLFSLATTKA